MFITLHLFLTSETYNSDCQKNKLQSSEANSRAIYRKTQALFHIGHMPNHTYCRHTNWLLQKTPNYQWKEATWQTQTLLQFWRILWSNDSFNRCISVLILYNLAKEKLLFSHQFLGGKTAPPNKPQVKKILLDGNNLICSEKFLLLRQWFKQNQFVNDFFLGIEFPPMLKILLLQISGQILLSRLIQLKRFISSIGSSRALWITW